MKTLPDVHKVIDEYHANNCVGLLLIHSGPVKRTGGKMEVWSEQAILVSDLDREFREAINTLAKGLEFFKAEIICGSSGPERIKVTRRL